MSCFVSRMAPPSKACYAIGFSTHQRSSDSLELPDGKVAVLQSRRIAASRRPWHVGNGYSIPHRMQRRWYVTTLALVAACSESAPTPTGPSLELPDQPDRVFWARGQGPAAPLGLMTGHGGDLMLASKTYAIYWGGDWNTPAFAGDKITGLTSFFQGWGGSAYAGALTEYGGQNGQVTTASTYVGSVIDPMNAPTEEHSVAAGIAER